MTKRAQERFAELKLKMFGDREQLVRFSDDGDLTQSNVRTVSVSDVKEFLDKAALSHRTFSHYTRIGAMKGMIMSRRFYLSRLSEMNDLDEYHAVADADKTYVACLSYGALENMAMWRTYGGSGEDSVRLVFNAKTVLPYMSEKRTIYEVKEEAHGPSCERGKEIPESEIGDWSFHDVGYQYGKALMWNRQVIGTGRCAELGDASNGNFAGYVKSFGWMTENEVRLVVRLKVAHPEWKHIAVDFAKAIESMTVVSGPCYPKKSRIEDICRENRMTSAKCIESRHVVRFRKD